MTGTRIKICGVRDADTALAAAEAGANAIGLVFAPESPRLVTHEQASRIIDALPAFVEPVGLFVNVPVEQVQETSRTLGLRTVQLHGRETPEEAAQLAPLRVIKALAFRPEGFEAVVSPWRAVRNRLAGVLWDNPADQEGSSAPDGGTGRAIDWRALASVQKTDAVSGLPPTLLAGGLTPENVAQAITLVRPYGVDVSSGVESSRGVKDAARIRAFCQAVREADRQRD